MPPIHHGIRQQLQPLIHEVRTMKTAKLSFPLFLGALLGAGGACAADMAPAGETKTQQLQQQIDQLSRQMDALKNSLKQVEAQNEALAAQQQQQAALAQQATSSDAGLSDKLSLWGYGELYYNHPVHQDQDTTADLARAVFGIGYRFDDRTVFNSEYEVEHAVSSADDPGEFEVEQFFVDHQLADWANVKAGLFLMPFGLINEHHEPTNFYGVQRNLVETLIIPSTWREGGIGFHGNTAAGLGWDVGVTTGFDLSKYEINPSEPLYASALDLAEGSPLQASHQELALAKAQHLSQYASLNYHGIPGLLAGASFFTGNAGHVQTAQADQPDQRVNLWEAHVRWTPGAADLSAVYARGTISNTAAYNSYGLGVSNPIPAAFEGYYVQAAYDLWHHGEYRLSPFVRWERYDLGASYEGIPTGYSTMPTGQTATGGTWPQPNDRVWTVGANFYLNPNVVLKADYQSFRNNRDFSRFDLGLGLNF
jgi:cell division protein FtsB